MDRRSTNDIGHAHFQGDVVSNVGSSHGVILRGASTGGIIEAFGDDTNIGLVLRAKGAGPLTIGLPNGLVDIDSTSVTIGAASTTGISFFQRSLLEFTVPALSSAGTAGAVSESTITLAGATTNSFILLQPRVALNSTITTGLRIDGRVSTAAELRLTITSVSNDTLTGSTMSAYLFQIRF